MPDWTTVALRVAVTSTKGRAAPCAMKACGWGRPRRPMRSPAPLLETNRDLFDLTVCL